ncbi:MAG: ABC transporter permease [Caldiserica bacterium]|jgi:putative ABC transport system permease protein|nr:ABC transporter permease [Caldisericota bacterium]MDH7561843.1 ABC transporter permease [Caldisericota bacterium]
MKFGRILFMALRALSHNKSRSFLTMLGVIIGVAAVMMMLSIGAGTQAVVTGRISSLGTNLLIIQPGNVRSGGVALSSQAQSLTLEDMEAISSIEGISSVAPTLSGRAQAIVGSNNTNTSVIGTTPEYKNLMNIKMSDGVFFAQTEVDQWDKVAILGSTVAETLFPEGNPVGQNVQLVVNRTKALFRVIGVMASKGGTGFSNQDDQILIPITTAQKILFGRSTLGQINVEVSSVDLMDQVSGKISQILRIRHNIAEGKSDDFSILNQQDLLETMSSVATSFTTLLAGIASISLLVGGIGIMNIMLVSVTERTREIGLKRAIGALRRDIIIQFLLEAIILSTTGGIVGILFGFVGSYLIKSWGNTTTLITVGSVLLGFLFSVAVGVFFGFYPAQKAAKLEPIEALRYE